MRETQESICQWAEETFGTAGSTARVAVRVLEEGAELLTKLAADDNHPGAPEEIADMAIVMCRLAKRLGVNDLFGRQPGYGLRPTSNLEEAAAACEWLIIAVRNLGRYGDDYPADVYVVSAWSELVSLARRMDFDIYAEIDRKMSINRARQWRLDGTGHGYHVRQETPHA